MRPWLEHRKKWSCFLSKHSDLIQKDRYNKHQSNIPSCAADIFIQLALSDTWGFVTVIIYTNALTPQLAAGHLKPGPPVTWEITSPKLSLPSFLSLNLFLGVFSCYFTAAAAGDDDDGTSSLHSNVILQHLHTASHFAGLQLSCT